MGWWPCYKHSKDHCAQEVTVKLNYISPVPTRTKSSCSDLSCSSNCYILTIQEMDMFSSSFIVHPFDQTEHFTNWVVILEQMHITQVNPFSLIKDTWPSDSRALVGSLLTTKLGCLDERTQEHVPKKEKKNKKNRGCVCEASTVLRFTYMVYSAICPWCSHRLLALPTCRPPLLCLVLCHPWEKATSHSAGGLCIQLLYSHTPTGLLHLPSLASLYFMGFSANLPVPFSHQGLWEFFIPPKDSVCPISLLSQHMHFTLHTYSLYYT